MEGPNNLEHFVPGKHWELLRAVVHFRLGSLPSDEEEKSFFKLAAARQISTSTPTRMGPVHSKGGHKESSVAIIEQLLADSSVVIFSKSYCPYCAKVKNFFQAPLT